MKSTAPLPTLPEWPHFVTVTPSSRIALEFASRMTDDAISEGIRECVEPYVTIFDYPDSEYPDRDPRLEAAYATERAVWERFNAALARYGVFDLVRKASITAITDAVDQRP